MDMKYNLQCCDVAITYNIELCLFQLRVGSVGTLYLLPNGAASRMRLTRTHTTGYAVDMHYGHPLLAYTDYRPRGGYALQL